MPPRGENLSKTLSTFSNLSLTHLSIVGTVSVSSLMETPPPPMRACVSGIVKARALLRLFLKFSVINLGCNVEYNVTTIFGLPQREGDAEWESATPFQVHYRGECIAFGEYLEIFHIE